MINEGGDFVNRIILVEDDTQVGNAIRAMIYHQFPGIIDVEIFKSGGDALSTIDNFGIDYFSMAMVEYNLSGILSGKELIRCMKNKKTDFPVAVMSSYMEKSEFFYSGADFMIEKPLRLNFISGIIKLALSIKK